MKNVIKTVVPLFILGATFAVASNNITQVQHVIIVIYSLSDFFDFTKFNRFQKINGAKYLPGCFHHPGDQNCFGNSTYPLDPDSDVNESD